MLCVQSPWSCRQPNLQPAWQQGTSDTRQRLARGSAPLTALSLLTAMLLVASVSAQDSRERRQEPQLPPDKNTFTNSIGMKLVLIPAGEFLMGGTDSLSELKKVFKVIVDAKWKDLYESDVPRHRVRITRPFHMGAHEVTVGQFRTFVEAEGYRTEAEKDGAGGRGFDPARSRFEGHKPQYSWRNVGWTQTNDHPVVNVTWNDAVAFCRWMSRREQKTYRLPTEAEWEYACRAGTTTRFWSGNEQKHLRGVANIADASLNARIDEKNWVFMTWNDGYPFTAPVGRLRSNGFGLFDMHGNVWEWCSDWYVADYYEKSPPESPGGPGSGSVRALRGGGFYVFPARCRSSTRDYDTPSNRYSVLGFRVVCQQ